MNESFPFITALRFVAIYTLLICFSSPANAQITGTVFHDYNIDEERQVSVSFGEPTLSGVSVKAYNDTGIEVASATSDASGNYTLNLAAGVYRIEFSNFPANFFPSAFIATSTGNGSSVQFRTSPSSSNNFALATIADYATHGESVFMGSYINGDHISAGSASESALTLTGFNYYGGRNL